MPILPAIKKFVAKTTTRTAVAGAVTMVTNVGLLVISSIMLIDTMNNPFPVFPLLRRRLPYGRKSAKSLTRQPSSRPSTPPCSVCWGWGSPPIFWRRAATQSGIENRDLAKFPEFSWNPYFNAEYTAGITEYFTDTAPGRTYKNIITDIRALFGITPKEGVIGVKPNDPVEDERPTGEVSDPLANR